MNWVRSAIAPEGQRLDRDAMRRPRPRTAWWAFSKCDGVGWDGAEIVLAGRSDLFKSAQLWVAAVEVDFYVLWIFVRIVRLLAAHLQQHQCTQQLGSARR